MRLQPFDHPLPRGARLTRTPWFSHGILLGEGIGMAMAIPTQGEVFTREGIKEERILLIACTAKGCRAG
jgi:hypothetical protein